MVVKQDHLSVKMELQVNTTAVGLLQHQSALALASLEPAEGVLDDKLHAHLEVLSVLPVQHGKPDGLTAHVQASMVSLKLPRQGRECLWIQVIRTLNEASFQTQLLRMPQTPLLSQLDKRT